MIELVKRKDTGMYLRYIYNKEEETWQVHEVRYMREQGGENEN